MGAPGNAVLFIGYRGVTKGTPRSPYSLSTYAAITAIGSAWERRISIQLVFSFSRRTRFLACFPPCSLCPLCEPCFLILGTNERGIAPSRREGALTPRLPQLGRHGTTGLHFGISTGFSLGTLSFSPSALRVEQKTTLFHYAQALNERKRKIQKERRVFFCKRSS